MLRQLDRPARSGLGVITAYRDGTVTLRSNRREDGYTFSDTENGYQEIRPGDLVFHALDGFAGAVGISDSHGNGSPVYHVCEPMAGDYPAYLARLLRHLGTSGFLTTQAPNVRERSVDFRNWSTFARIPLVLPPADEQRFIADYLDRETARIDTLIEEQQRLIEMLHERRRSVMQHAVAGSDRSGVRQTGDAWWPELPDGWAPVSLRRVLRGLADGPHFSPNYVDNGVMFLSARNIKVDGWSLDDAKFVSEADYLEFSKRVVPEPGDVLYTKGGTTGIARVVDLDFPFQVWVHVAVLKVRRDLVEPSFLAYALNSDPCYEQSQLFTRGATNNDLGLTRIVNIVAPLPPLDEQRRIVAYLNDEIAKIDALIAETERFIELAWERRSALITAAVTGQIDVREVA
ncbi:restriction endonuclease subunit S [Streptomyces sp. ACT015]|uniref:restriction endonuclease subunit S n=1 Tax=Streptomyces sp. ACT015 TaxID=3134807 RepID=UPI003D175776